MIFFQEALQFLKPILLCYNEQITIKMITRMPLPSFKSLLMAFCVFNQSRAHSLLSDVLIPTIFICLKLIKEPIIFVSLDNFIEHNYCS
jgi:hypothetical protein